MYVKILPPMIDRYYEGQTRDKNVGDLLKCYRHELLFTHDGQVREEWFLVESQVMQKNVYVTTPVDDYTELAYLDPNLPEDYRKGHYLWVGRDECEPVELNNSNMSHLLTRYEWSLT